MSWTSQRRGQKDKMFSGLRLFSEWHTPFCECACGWAFIFVLGLYMSPWRSPCPTLNVDDGQKSLLKPLRAVGQQIYIKIHMWGLNNQQSNTNYTHHSSVWLMGYIYYLLRNVSRFDDTGHKQPTMNSSLRSYSEWLLAYKDWPSVECRSPQGNACRPQSFSVRDWQPVRLYKRTQRGGWTTGVTGLLKRKQ